MCQQTNLTHPSENNHLQPDGNSLTTWSRLVLNIGLAIRFFSEAWILESFSGTKLRLFILQKSKSTC